MTSKTHQSPWPGGWATMLFVTVVASATPTLAGSADDARAERDFCSENDEARYVVESIEVSGLERTRDYVIDRELLVDEGEAAQCAEFVESVQRLKNTNLFRTVDFELVPVESPQKEGTQEDEDRPRPVRFLIDIDEKWTALPNFQFSTGGGALRAVVGAQETNLFGHYLFIGGQFEHVQGANSFFGWFENPRTFDERLKSRAELGTQNRVYHLFDEDGERDGGFFQRRFLVGGLVEHEWRWWLRTEGGVRYERDRFSQRLIPEDQRRAEGDPALPDATDSLVGRLAVILGRLNTEEYLQDGVQATLSVEHANSHLGSTHDRFHFGFNTFYFETLPLKSNLAAYVRTGLSDVEAPHHRHYVGGLDALRGFPYDRYSGEHYWVANLEYRIPSVDIPWLALQHVAFVDAARVGERVSELAGLSGASTGLGVRILVPKIQNLIIRLDYAIPLLGDVQNPWNLAGDQFY